MEICMVDHSDAVSTPSEQEGSSRCAQCGLNLKPLARPHTSKDCSMCGQACFIANPLPPKLTMEFVDNAGAPIRAPRHYSFSLSTDPEQVPSRLSRAGMAWLLKMRYFQSMPEHPDELDVLLDWYTQDA